MVGSDPDETLEGRGLTWIVSASLDCARVAFSILVIVGEACTAFTRTGFVLAWSGEILPLTAVKPGDIVVSEVSEPFPRGCGELLL